MAAPKNRKRTSGGGGLQAADFAQLGSMLQQMSLAEAQKANPQYDPNTNGPMFKPRSRILDALSGRAGSALASQLNAQQAINAFNQGREMQNRMTLLNAENTNSLGRLTREDELQRGRMGLQEQINNRAAEIQQQYAIENKTISHQQALEMAGIEAQNQLKLQQNQIEAQKAAATEAYNRDITGAKEKQGMSVLEKMNIAYTPENLKAFNDVTISPTLTALESRLRFAPEIANNERIKSGLLDVSKGQTILDVNSMQPIYEGADPLAMLAGGKGRTGFAPKGSVGTKGGFLTSKPSAPTPQVATPGEQQMVPSGPAPMPLISGYKSVLGNTEEQPLLKKPKSWEEAFGMTNIGSLLNLFK